jgi:hypothetical protein
MVVYTLAVRQETQLGSFQPRLGCTSTDYDNNLWVSTTWREGETTRFLRTLWGLGVEGPDLRSLHWTIHLDLQILSLYVGKWVQKDLSRVKFQTWLLSTGLKALDSEGKKTGAQETSWKFWVYIYICLILSLFDLKCFYFLFVCIDFLYIDLRSFSHFFLFYFSSLPLFCSHYVNHDNCLSVFNLKLYLSFPSILFISPFPIYTFFPSTLE